MNRYRDCKMIRHAFFLLLAAFMYLAPGNVHADEGDGQKAILITGASTGIGRNMAETLSAVTIS